jgi:hypothetical protein
VKAWLLSKPLPVTVTVSPTFPEVGLKLIELGEFTVMPCEADVKPYREALKVVDPELVGLKYMVELSWLFAGIVVEVIGVVKPLSEYHVPEPKVVAKFTATPQVW